MSIATLPVVLLSLTLRTGPLRPPVGTPPVEDDTSDQMRLFDPDATKPRRSIQRWLEQPGLDASASTPVHPQPPVKLLGLPAHLRNPGPNLQVPRQLVVASLSGSALKLGGSYSILPFPLIASDSDNGTGFGAIVEFFYEDGTDPYRFSAVVNGYETTLGVADDFIDIDWLNALGTRFRLQAEIRVRNENNASYFGIGNRSPPLPAATADTLVTYGKADPALHVVLRHPIGSRGWLLYASYLYEHAFIRTYPGSVAATQLPNGVQGGNNAPLTVGVAYDTRDSEIWTTQGSFNELSLRGAALVTGSRYTWAGGTLAVRHFWRLPFELVLAEQLIADVMSTGNAFYDLNATGALQETNGLGGENSLRGFVKDRFLGDVKLFGNLELRRILFSFDLLGNPWHFGLVTFFEAGRVYDHLIDNGAFLTDGPPLLIHWDAGLGPRLVFGQSFLLRVDVAMSVEGPRYYLTARNMF